jgi:protein-tyrosine phosphatase
MPRGPVIWEAPMGADRNEKTHSKRLPAVALVVCLVGGAVWLWEGVAKDRLIPKRWATVEGHNIYRSGQLCASLVKKTLANHGIKVVVALTADDPQDKDQQAEERVAAELGIELRRFPLRGDGTGDINQYAGAVAAVVEAERQGKPVLIHCAAGAQRTGGVIAFYRLLVDRKPPADVVQELRHHGWNPKRNPNLLPYIDENLARLATILHDRGLLDEVPDPLPVLQAP